MPRPLTHSGSESVLPSGHCPSRPGVFCPGPLSPSKVPGEPGVPARLVPRKGTPWREPADRAAAAPAEGVAAVTTAARSPELGPELGPGRRPSPTHTSSVPPQAPEASPAQGQTQRSPETQSLGCRGRAGGFPSGRRSGRANPAGLRRDRTADRTGAGLPPALRSPLCLPQRRHLEPWLGPFGSGLRGCTVRTEARHRLWPSPARPLSPLRPRRPTKPWAPGAAGGSAGSPCSGQLGSRCQFRSAALPRAGEPRRLITVPAARETGGRRAPGCRTPGAALPPSRLRFHSASKPFASLPPRGVRPRPPRDAGSVSSSVRRHLISCPFP